MPVTPPLVAITLVLPSATAVARPVVSPMDATVESLNSHVKLAPVIKLSFASNASAVYCCVSPKDVRVAVAGATVTEATV